MINISWNCMICLRNSGYLSKNNAIKSSRSSFIKNIHPQFLNIKSLKKSYCLSKAHKTDIEKAEAALSSFRESMTMMDPKIMDSRHRDLIGLHNIIVHKAYNKSRDRIFNSIEKHFSFNEKIDPKKEKIIEDIFKDLMTMKLNKKFTHEDIILQEQIYQNARQFADDVIRYQRKMQKKTIEIPDRKEPLLFPDEPNKPLNVDIEIRNYMEELVDKLNKFAEEESLLYKDKELPKLKPPFFNDRAIELFNGIIKKYGILYISIFAGIGIVRGVILLGLSYVGLDPEVYTTIENCFNIHFAPLYLFLALYLTPRLYEPFQKQIERVRKYQKTRQL